MEKLWNFFSGDLYEPCAAQDKAWKKLAQKIYISSSLKCIVNLNEIDAMQYYFIFYVSIKLQEKMTKTTLYIIKFMLYPFTSHVRRL